MFFATRAWDVVDELIKFANCVTMKLDNQNNGSKRVCSYQEANGDPLPRKVISPASMRRLQQKLFSQCATLWESNFT